MRAPFAVLAILIPVAAPAVAESLTIQGTVTVSPELSSHLEADDRLVIKLYHPGDGVELDAKYQIADRFMLPQAFVAAPTIDMNASTKFDAYVIEVFTDKDDDVLGIAPGELVGSTETPVALGSTGVEIQLNALRE